MLAISVLLLYICWIFLLGCQRYCDQETGADSWQMSERPSFWASATPKIPESQAADWWMQSGSQEGQHKLHLPKVGLFLKLLHVPWNVESLPCTATISMRKLVIHEVNHNILKLNKPFDDERKINYLKCLFEICVCMTPIPS